MTASILIVDDDELIRNGFRINLEREGYHVRTACSQEEALAMVAHEPPDLLLCDLILTDGDGISLVTELGRRSPGLPVILITAHGSIPNVLEALRAGARDYIQKPASPEEIAHRIRMVLDQEAMRRSLATEREHADSRRKELDEQLIRAERMASIGLLAEGAASHLKDILQPLRDIATRLTEPGGRPMDAGGVAAEVAELARQADAVLEDLMALGQNGRFQTAEFSIGELLAKFLGSGEYAGIRRLYPQVRVQIHNAGLLPCVHGEPAALQRTVEHLLLNACESAAPAGHVDVTLMVEQVDRPVGRYGRAQPGQYVVLRVRDSGPRPSDEDVERYFEPFYAQRKMGRRELGGLGLALVLRVVSEHGGFVDVTRDSAGNVVHVYLPAAAAGVGEPATSWSGSELLLVVDDQEHYRQHAREMLEGFGYRVITAAGRREAVEICRRQRAGQEPVSLVVMDLLLGDELDGVDIVRILQEEQGDLRALFVSGFADTSRIAEARKLGFRHWVQKPLTSSVLGKAVRRELDPSRHG